MLPTRATFLTLLLAALCLNTCRTDRAAAQMSERARERARIGMSTRFDDIYDYMSLYESGWRKMSKGQFDAAEREFGAAVRIAQRPELADPRLMARSYSALAWALQQQGRLRDAEPYAKWALDTRLAQFGSTGDPVARSLNQMAMIYLATNRFNAAEPLLRQVIAMDGGKSEVIEQEQAQAESLFGLGLVAQRRYAEAESEFGRAVAIRKEAQGLKNPELGDELNNLAWSQIEQGKLTEARPVMDQSLKILRQNRGDNDASVARSLDGLARIDAEENKLADAEAKYQRVVAIYERLGAPRQARLGETLKQYADLLDRMHRTEDARRIKVRLAALKQPAQPADLANANFTVPKPVPQPVTPGRGRPAQ